MKNSEVIMEMYKMQVNYDDQVFKTYPDLDVVCIVLLDKLGKVNHEMLNEWAWGQSSMNPIKKWHVITGIADALSKAFTLIHMTDHGDEMNKVLEIIFDTNKKGYMRPYTKRWNDVLDSFFEYKKSLREIHLYDLVCALIGFALQQGFEIKQLSDAYSYLYNTAMAEALFKEQENI